MQEDCHKLKNTLLSKIIRKLQFSMQFFPILVVVCESKGNKHAVKTKRIRQVLTFFRH